METDYFHSRVLRQYKITPEVEFSPIKHGLLLLLCCNIKRVSCFKQKFLTEFVTFFGTLRDLCSMPIVNALLNFNMAKTFKVLLTEQKSIVILHDINSIHQESKSPTLLEFS
jgi:hypothetical protein